mgnify:CR=1 FL=1
MIPVHFIGKGKYTPESFAEEAKKVGVSRALPLQVALGLEFGDKILLAMDMSNCRAYLFGGFVVSGFTPLNLTPEEKKAFFESIKIKKTNKVQELIKRGCGTYILETEMVIEENQPFKECLQKLKGIKKDAKILLNGVYFDLKKPFEYFPLCFTRGITHTDLGIPDADKNIVNALAGKVENIIFEIKDYNKKK